MSSTNERVWRRRLGIGLAVITLVAGVATRSAEAATAKEALKCGTALRKLQAKQLSLLSKTLVTLCKKPGDLTVTAAKITATLNKAIVKINAKFNAGNCDPDIVVLGGLPLSLLQPATIQAQIVGFTTPLDTLCNGLADQP